MPNEIIINTVDGSTFSFNVEPQESFINVIEAIKQHENSLSETQVFIAISPNQITATTGYAVKGKPRNFWTPLTAKEKEDITYILRTLANETLLKVNSSKAALKKAGDRIDHIHPLRFLTFIFSNDEMIVCMRNLQGRTWVWSEFLEGTVESLKNEYGIGNILDEHVQELIRQAKVPDPGAIHSLVHSQSWGSLINTLISVVPRQTEGNRYDM